MKLSRLLEDSMCFQLVYSVSSFSERSTSILDVYKKQISNIPTMHLQITGYIVRNDNVLGITMRSSLELQK